MINLAFINIKNSLSSYKKIYMLLLISQMVAVLVLFFVYGIVVSYEAAKVDKLSDSLYMGSRITEKSTITEMKDALPEILETVEDRLDYFAILVKDTDKKVIIINSYADGVYELPIEHFGNERLLSGRYMTTEEINNGSKVVICGNSGFKAGDTYIIGNETFEIAGIINTHEMEYTAMSLNSCPEELVVSRLDLVFSKYPKQSDYDTFVNVMKKRYGNNVVFTEFNLMETDDIIAYDSIIVLALAIGVVAALDTILVYNYLMKKRKKQMAIFGIEGATRLQQILINETEVAIITVITSLVGVIIFRLAVERVIMEVYKIGISIFNIKVYGLMLLAFIGCILLGAFVMTVINTRKKALDMRRG